MRPDAFARLHPDVLHLARVWCDVVVAAVCLPPTATWSSLAMPLPREGGFAHTLAHARPLVCFRVTDNDMIIWQVFAGVFS